LLRNAPAPAEAGEELARMLTQLRSLALHHLIELGDSMPAAVAIGEPLTAELERLLGSGHPDTIRAQNELALAYREAGRVAEAVPLLERALAAEEQLLGAGHASTLVSRNNLGSVYRATGRPAEAVVLFEQNAAACEALLGADHPRTLASRHSLELARQESAQAAARQSG
jgi:tetratricopeptide (TPR) repeat protein